jgi:hypothetical protein
MSINTRRIASRLPQNEPKCNKNDDGDKDDDAEQSARNRNCNYSRL